MQCKRNPIRYSRITHVRYIVTRTVSCCNAETRKQIRARAEKRPSVKSTTTTGRKSAKRNTVSRDNRRPSIEDRLFETFSVANRSLCRNRGGSPREVRPNRFSIVFDRISGTFIDSSVSRERLKLVALHFRSNENRLRANQQRKRLRDGKKSRLSFVNVFITVKHS